MLQTKAKDRVTIASPTIATSLAASGAPLASIAAVGLVLTLAAHQEMRFTQSWSQRITLTATAGTVPTTPIAAMPSEAALGRKLRRRARIEKLLAQVTQEQWAQTPPDLSANIDAIVYG